MELVSYLMDKVPALFTESKEKHESTHMYLLFRNYLDPLAYLFVGVPVPDASIPTHAFLGNDWVLTVTIFPCTCHKPPVLQTHAIIMYNACPVCKQLLQLSVDLSGARLPSYHPDDIQVIFDDIVTAVKLQEGREHYYPLENE